jgi:DNA-directed RNA polymerase sigma subunit (sigma70/sigma32)
MTASERLALDGTLRTLPDRYRLVIELRVLTQPRMTLKQVGERLGVSYQRAGQLQAGALWRVGCH